MYNMHVVLATDGEKPIAYPLSFGTKKDLHKMEKGFVKALDTLVKLTEDELKTGKKPFDKTDPRTMVFEVNIDKDGADYGGYRHRWPNQSVEARAFLTNLLKGLMDGMGYGKAKHEAV